MSKREIVIIADYSEEQPLSLQELCDICHITSDTIQHFVEYDIIHPTGDIDTWQFNMMELQRIKQALRLQRDLEVNLAGVALVLDLMDQLKTLREKMELLERHR